MGLLHLSREQTIIEHRKMWNWLADQYEAGHFVSKADYIDQTGFGEVTLNCFCCDYDDNYCLDCPICWGEGLYARCGEDDTAFTHWYDLVDFFMTTGSRITYESFQLLAKYAREIANLPEKEVENDSE